MAAVFLLTWRNVPMEITLNPEHLKLIDDGREGRAAAYKLREEHEAILPRVMELQNELEAVQQKVMDGIRKNLMGKLTSAALGKLKAEEKALKEQAEDAERTAQVYKQLMDEYSPGDYATQINTARGELCKEVFAGWMAGLAEDQDLRIRLADGYAAYRRAHPHLVGLDVYHGRPIWSWFLTETFETFHDAAATQKADDEMVAKYAFLRD